MIDWKKSSTWKYFLYSFICFMLTVTAVMAVYIHLSYKREHAHLKSHLSLINETYLPFFISSLWVTDYDAVQKQINGMVRFNYIDRVEVKNDEGEIWSAGDRADPLFEVVSRDLIYSFRGEKQKIGSISLYINKAQMHADIRRDVLVVFFMQVVLALILAGGIAGTFYFVIGKHLLRFARFLEEDDPKTVSRPFVPDRFAVKDELQLLVEHFNSMRHRIGRYVVEAEKWHDLMRYIIGHDPNAIAVYDKDLRYVYVSDRYFSDFRIKDADIIGKNLYEVFPETPKKWREAHEQALAGKAVRAEEDFFVQADGTVDYTQWDCRPWYGTDGSIAGIVIYTEFITGRKKSELALKESQRFLASIFDTIQDGISVMDTEFNIIMANKTMDHWFAQTRPLIGKQCYEAYHGRSERCRICPAARTMTTGKLESEEMTYIREDHTQGTLEVYAHPMFDDKGNAKGTVKYFRDITSRKTAEAEKEKLQAQLLQSQKMESVGRLAGGVAHDFNNMLTIINGYAEMMSDVLSPADPMHKSVCKIQEAGKRSAVIIRKLLAFARKQTIDPVPLNLNDNVSNMLKMLQRLIGENIDLLWKPGKDLWVIKMDFSQIDQILANLVVNAKDAIGDVGKITIETENIDFDDEYCKTHAGFIPGRYVMLAVSDNGCGMDKDVMDNLFEPFFTTKEIGKGTGLGLPTVYGSVKQNNGFVNVYSEPGQGTTVRIYFPRVLEDAGIEEKKKRDEPLSEGHGETILVLEDEATVMNITRIMLEKLGYKVLASRSPNEAMANTKDHGGKIDLLITDVVMPEMNGREFASQIKTLYPNIKVLFMSGYTANVIAHHGVLDEGVKFIQKPFSMGNLAVKVRKTLGKE